MTTKHSNALPRRDDVGDRRIAHLRLERIKVGTTRREHNDDAVNNMAVSMRDIGLINPVTVVCTGKDDDGTKKYSLACGNLRLKAAALLGWKRIAATVLEGGKEETRLCEIAENLFRTELTVLERSELVAEWVGIVRRKAAHGKHPGGQQPNDKGISEAARKLKLSRAMISRSEAIAGLSKEAKAAAKAAKLANSTRSLMKIAAEKGPANQLDTIEQIRSRNESEKGGKGKKVQKKKSKPHENKSPSIVSPNNEDGEEGRSSAIEDPSNADDDSSDADFFNLKAAWQNSPGFVAAWNAARLPARERFVVEILRHSPIADASQIVEAA
jgi:hypothetical protein